MKKSRDEVIQVNFAGVTLVKLPKDTQKKNCCRTYENKDLEKLLG